eukprot:g3384.t1
MNSFPNPASKPHVATICSDGRLQLSFEKFENPNLDCFQSQSTDLILKEVSAASSCTRAGQTVVIDFIFAANVIGKLGAKIESSPLPVTSNEEEEKSANAVHGVGFAIRNFGSDHLPIAAKLNF